MCKNDLNRENKERKKKKMQMDIDTNLNIWELLIGAQGPQVILIQSEKKETITKLVPFVKGPF